MARLVNQWREIAVLGISLSLCTNVLGAYERSHTIESLHYGNALYQSLTQDPLSGVLPLDVAIERGQLQLESSPYPFLYRADLQFRLGLHQRAEQGFLQLEETLVNDVSADRLNEIWFRLGELFYSDGHFEQALSLLQKINIENQAVINKSEEINFLIDDMYIRKGLPVTHTYTPEMSHGYWLEYRALLGVDFIKSQSRWKAFFEGVTRVKTPSADFLMMIERAKLSYLVLASQYPITDNRKDLSVLLQNLNLSSSLSSDLVNQSFTSHYLSPLIEAYTQQKPVVLLSQSTGNIAHVQSLLNLWSKEGEAKLHDLSHNTLNHNTLKYNAYADLHNDIRLDLEQSQYMLDKSAFKAWFSEQLDADFYGQLDWFPWLTQHDVRQMRRSLTLLNSVAANLSQWADRFPYLQSVFEQHQAYYNKSAQGIDFTNFIQRYEQAQARLAALNSNLAETFPSDTKGLLLSDDLAVLQHRVDIASDRLEKLFQAGMVNEKNYQKKKTTLQKAKGRIIWDAELQWSDRYRQVSKNTKIIEELLIEAQKSIVRIQIGIEHWPGQQFSTRLQHLEGRLKQISNAIAVQTDNAKVALADSAFVYAHKIYDRKHALHQIALQNKIVFAEQLAQANPTQGNLDQLIQDYTLLLQGTLTQGDRSQAWLGLAGQYFYKGELDPSAYTDAISFYKKWLYESGLKTKHPRDLHEAVLYRIAESYALLTQQKESIATLEQILVAFPTGQYLDEVQFRLAENAYSNADYEQAAHYYAKQISSRPASNLTLKSLYMLGWCHLKLGQLDQSLDQFLSVLESANQTQHKDTSISSLEDDSKRIAVLVIERAGGVEMLGQRFKAPLSDLGYQTYTLYFDSLQQKELYFKLYESVEYFQQQYPKYAESSKLAMAMVELLEKHSFFEAKRQQQALFLQRYTDSAGLAYALELGNYYRSLKTQVGYNQALQYYTLLYSRWHEITQEQHIELPVQLSQLQFRIADTHFDLGQYELAQYELSIPLYEQIAYPQPFNTQISPMQPHDTDYLQREKAGIAQLTALKKLDATQWAVPLQESRLKFIENFPQHTIASQLRLEAASYEFTQQHFKNARELVKPLYVMLFNKSKLNMPKITAFDISVLDLYATVLYNNGQYSEAAEVYQHGLKYEGLPDEKRQSWYQRFGDALFIVAEKAAAAGQHGDVITPLHVLLEEAPEHTLAAAAAFDQGVAYEALNVPKQALESWQKLIQQYPSSPLVGKTSLRMAKLLEQQHNFGPAAEALLLYQKSVEITSPLYSELTLKMAGLYKQALMPSQAIFHYKRIAHSLSLKKKNTEVTAWFVAVENLINLYSISDVTKANFWRRKSIESGIQDFQSLPGHAQQTVLSSSAYFAVEKQNAFESLPLKPPFERTLPQKQQALTEAISAYEQLLGFGVSPAYEHAIYGLGNLYLQFAAELTDSERPSGLSDLALEEYEILLEEQAYDFEEKGLEYHEENLQRLWDGENNQHTLASLAELQKRLSKYKRHEKVEAIHSYAQ